MGLVKTLLAGVGFAFGHALDSLLPDICGREGADLGAGDGFDIRCETLFEPVVVGSEGGKRGVDELMGRGPVVGKLLRGSVLTEANAGEGRKAADAAPGGARQNTVEVGRGDDKDAGAGDGKAAVVGGDGAGGGVDPLDERSVR